MIYFFIALRRRIRRFIGALRALGLAGLAIGVVVSGTFLFYFTEPILPSGARNTLFSSFYWVIVTLSTVGYGDITPTNFWAKIVFFYVVLVGLGIFAASLTEIGSYITNKRFLQIRGLHRFKLKRHVIIAGYGDSTDELIDRLARHDMDVVVVDGLVDPAMMKARGINLVSDNFLHADALKKAGIAGADSIVISSQPDEVAVMLSLKARELNPNISVVAGCQKIEDFQTMTAAKIDVVVPVSKLQGDLLADAVVDSKGLEFMMQLLGGRDGLRIEETAAKEPTTVGKLMSSAGGRAVALFVKDRFVVEFDDETPLDTDDYVLSLKPKRLL